MTVIDFWYIFTLSKDNLFHVMTGTCKITHYQTNIGILSLNLIYLNIDAVLAKGLQFYHKKWLLFMF